MKSPTLKRPPFVEVTRLEVLDRGSRVSTFAGGALSVSVEGPVMTIEASDGNGVFMKIIVTERADDAPSYNAERG